MNEVDKFFSEVEDNIEKLRSNNEINTLSMKWLEEATKAKYVYNFTWLGRPIIQLPQDIMAIQELIWKSKPELIIETGIAHGGSLIFHSSLLELIGQKGKVLGIDIDIRKHNSEEIKKHPMSKNIDMIEGSSINEEVVQQVYKYAYGKKNIMVILDSNHTHEHVLKELNFYSSLVKKDNYLIVLDTLIEDMPDDLSNNRSWGKGNNPKTAVREFLKSNDRFVNESKVDNKLLLTVAPEGYLRCIKD